MLNKHCEVFMKKNSLVFIIITLATATSMAKIDNFNQMIRENQFIQNELQDQLKTKHENNSLHGLNNDAVQLKKNIKNDHEYSVHSPTKKSFLKFSKEKQQFKASEKKQFDRIAEEFSELN